MTFLRVFIRLAATTMLDSSSCVRTRFTHGLESTNRRPAYVSLGDLLLSSQTCQAAPIFIHLDGRAPGAPWRITADKAGTFPFECSHFCGFGHKRMKGELVVE